jgi:sn-glycerol 3-phosphate transport system permease protein
VIDGAHWWQTLWHVLLPMARPGLIAFSLVSLMAHWNEFLWPLMVLNEPSTQTLTIGLASFALGTEGGREWGLLAAGTLLVMFPLLALFAIFQRQFVNSFMFAGLKG